LKYVLSEEEKNMLCNTTGRVINGQKMININLIYSTKFLLAVQNMYNKLDVVENEADDAIDAAGYTGNFRRVLAKDLQFITQIEFIEVFKGENKLGELMRIIQTIDRDHNGYVTSTEMDDILKLLYPDKLKNYNLK